MNSLCEQNVSKTCLSPLDVVYVVLKRTDTSEYTVSHPKGVYVSNMYCSLLHNGHSKCLRVPYELLTASTVPISYRPSGEKRNISQPREAMTHSLHRHRVKALHGEDVGLLHIVVLWL